MHTCAAADLSAPTLRILPEDVAQDTVRQRRISTNNYAVIWAYTEAGANKVLAFREVHKDQRVRMAIGKFESQPSIERFIPMPPMFTSYTQWKEGWLKHKGDKFVGVTEEDAKKIIAGLQGK